MTVKQNPEPARQRLGAWLKEKQRAGVIKLHVDSDGDPRDFDCALCGCNFDLFSTKKIRAASFVAAHVNSCALSHPRAP